MYTVTTSYVLPLKKKGNDDPIETIKKKKTLKPILHPIFEKFSTLTEDKFWVNTFKNCARGKFPRCFSFKNSLLCYRKGNKNQRLEIPDSPTEAFTLVINFFRTVGGILSNEDRISQQKMEEEKLLEKMIDESEMSWKDIKTEKIREILINEFITDLSINNNFNEQERKELTTTIKKGFMLKYFTADNVILEDGRIVELDGLIYNDASREYEINKNLTRSRKSGRKYIGTGINDENEENKNKIDFLELWEKFLLQLENKRIKKNFSSTYSQQIESSES